MFNAIWYVFKYELPIISKTAMYASLSRILIDTHNMCPIIFTLLYANIIFNPNPAYVCFIIT